MTNAQQQQLSDRIDALLFALTQQTQAYFFGTWVSNLSILKEVLERSGYHLTSLQQTRIQKLLTTQPAVLLLHEYFKTDIDTFKWGSDLLHYFAQHMHDAAAWEALLAEVLPSKPNHHTQPKTWHDLPRARQDDLAHTLHQLPVQKAFDAWQHKLDADHSSSSSSPARQTLPKQAYEARAGLTFLVSQAQIALQYFQLAIYQYNRNVETKIDWQTLAAQAIALVSHYVQLLSSCTSVVGTYHHTTWGPLHGWRDLIHEMGVLQIIYCETVSAANWQNPRTLMNIMLNAADPPAMQWLGTVQCLAGIRQQVKSASDHTEFVYCLERLVAVNQQVMSWMIPLSQSRPTSDQIWRRSLAAAREPFDPVQAIAEEIPIPMRAVQIQYSEQVQILLQHIAKWCTAQLSHAPCTLVLVQLGSGARGDNTIFSDGEWALVYEARANASLEEINAYLHSWLRLFQTCLFSLGETISDEVINKLNHFHAKGLTESLDHLRQQAREGLRLDSVAAQKAWFAYQERLGEQHSLANDCMLAFTLDEWQDYVWRNRSKVAGQPVWTELDEIEALQERLNDEDYFALLGARCIYSNDNRSETNDENDDENDNAEAYGAATRVLQIRPLAERFQQQLTDFIQLPAETNCYALIDPALPQIAQTHSLQLSQGQLTGWVIFERVLTAALQQEQTLRNSGIRFHLKTQFQIPLTFFVQWLRLWCGTKSHTTQGILKEAQRHGWLPYGFVQLVQAALEQIATLRNGLSQWQGYQCEAIADTLYPEVCRRFNCSDDIFHGITMGILRPLQNVMQQIKQELTEQRLMVALSSPHIFYQIGWQVLQAFLTQRMIWFEQNGSHPWCAVLDDYPNERGWSVSGVRQMQAWQQHLDRQVITEPTSYRVQSPAWREERYLPLELGQQLFDAHGQPQSNAQYSTNRHAIQCINGVFYKTNLDDDVDIFGRELIVQHIHFSLGGRSLAPGLLWRIEVQTPRRTTSYWMWVSQAIAGELLADTIQQTPERLTLLQPRSVAEHFFLALATVQQDGQPFNFRLVSVDGLLQLIGFDVGHAFVQCTNETGIIFKKQILVLKSIVLLLHHMDGSLEKFTGEKIKLVHPIHWLRALRDYMTDLNEQWRTRLQPVVPASAQDKMADIIRIPEEALLWLEAVLVRFQTSLTRDHKTTMTHLLSRISAQLYGFYRHNRQLSGPLDYAKLNFSELEPGAYRTFSIEAPDGSGQRVILSSTYLSKDLRKLEQISQQIKTQMQPTAEDFEHVDFRLLVNRHSNPHEQWQWLQLQLMQGVAFEQLNLAGCVVLTDQILRQMIVKSPDLQLLDITDCKNITGNPWLNSLLKTHPNIQIKADRTRILGRGLLSCLELDDWFTQLRQSSTYFLQELDNRHDNQLSVDNKFIFLQAKSKSESNCVKSYMTHHMIPSTSMIPSIPTQDTLITRKFIESLFKEQVSDILYIWNQYLISSDPSIINAIQSEIKNAQNALIGEIYSKLKNIVLSSRHKPENSIASANAMTLLVSWSVSLAKEDFSHTHLCGANLKNGFFYGANFAGADLSGCELDGADFTHSSLQGACLTNVSITNSVQSTNTRRFACIAVSKNGRFIALNSNHKNAIALWDLADGTLCNLMHGHTGQVNSLAFSLDGNILISGSDDKTIRIWNIKTNSCRKIIVNDAGDGAGAVRVTCVAISPNGKLIASGDVAQYLTLWDAITGKNIATANYTNPVAHMKASYKDIYGIKSITFSPFGNHIMTLNGAGLLCMWTINWYDAVKINKVRGEIAPTNTFWDYHYVSTIALSPDGSLTATAHDAGGDLELMNTSDGSCHKKIKILTTAIAFSPDGRFIICGKGKHLNILDIVQGISVQHIEIELERQFIDKLAVYSDGCVVCSLSSALILLKCTGETWDSLWQICWTKSLNNNFEECNIRETHGLSEENRAVLKQLGAIDAPKSFPMLISSTQSQPLMPLHNAMHNSLALVAILQKIHRHSSSQLKTKTASLFPPIQHLVKLRKQIVVMDVYDYSITNCSDAETLISQIIAEGIHPLYQTMLMTIFNDIDMQLNALKHRQNQLQQHEENTRTTEITRPPSSLQEFNTVTVAHALETMTTQDAEIAKIEKHKLFFKEKQKELDTLTVQLQSAVDELKIRALSKIENTLSKVCSSNSPL